MFVIFSNFATYNKILSQRPKTKYFFYQIKLKPLDRFYEVWSARGNYRGVLLILEYEDI